MSMTEKQAFIELRAKGITYEKIAKKLGKTKQTLINWSKELTEEIANHREIELESLRAQYLATKEARLKVLSDNLDRVEKALEKRTLEDVCTDKLMSLALKLSQQLAAEEIDIVFSKKHPLANDSHLDKVEWIG